MHVVAPRPFTEPLRNEGQGNVSRSGFQPDTSSSSDRQVPSLPIAWEKMPAACLTATAREWLAAAAALCFKLAEDARVPDSGAPAHPQQTASS